MQFSKWKRNPRKVEKTIQHAYCTLDNINKPEKLRFSGFLLLKKMYDKCMIFLLVGNKKERKDFVRYICEEQGLDIQHIQRFYADDFLESSFSSRVPIYTGLFGERECFVFHNIVRDVVNKDLLKSYSETDHILIFSEDSILKKDLIFFEKIGAGIHQFEKEVKIESQKYNTFTLADLLGARDKKNLWLAFREAISTVSAEEIHGILFWQIKNLALIKTSTSNPGMSPFVYSKNQSFVNNYSLPEIQELSAEMVKIFHTRDTYSTLEIDLEKIILGL